MLILQEHATARTLEENLINLKNYIYNRQISFTPDIQLPQAFS